jgi:hypothetical protein
MILKHPGSMDLISTKQNKQTTLLQNRLFFGLNMVTNRCHSKRCEGTNVVAGSSWPNKALLRKVKVLPLIYFWVSSKYYRYFIP